MFKILLVTCTQNRYMCNCVYMDVRHNSQKKLTELENLSKLHVQNPNNRQTDVIFVNLL